MTMFRKRIIGVLTCLSLLVIHARCMKQEEIGKHEGKRNANRTRRRIDDLRRALGASSHLGKDEQAQVMVLDPSISNVPSVSDRVIQVEPRRRDDEKEMTLFTGRRGDRSRGSPQAGSTHSTSNALAGTVRARTNTRVRLGEVPHAVRTKYPARPQTKKSALRNWQFMRRCVSGYKKRYIQNENRAKGEKKLMLDLSYIAGKMIAMSYPTKGFCGRQWRNPMATVQEFFTEKYQQVGKILVVNLCSESHKYSYANGENDPSEKAFGNMATFPFDDHSVPPFDKIQGFLENTVDTHMENEENVLAIHCKGGKGRTGMFCCIYLLHTAYTPELPPGHPLRSLNGNSVNAETAQHLFGGERVYTHYNGVPNDQGVNQSSQKRWVHYYERFLRGEERVRHLVLKRIVIEQKEAKGKDRQTRTPANPGTPTWNGDRLTISTFKQGEEWTEGCERMPMEPVGGVIDWSVHLDPKPKEVKDYTMPKLSEKLNVTGAHNFLCRPDAPETKRFGEEQFSSRPAPEGVKIYEFKGAQPLLKKDFKISFNDEMYVWLNCDFIDAVSDEEDDVGVIKYCLASDQIDVINRAKPSKKLVKRDIKYIDNFRMVLEFEERHSDI